MKRCLSYSEWSDYWFPFLSGGICKARFCGRWCRGEIYLCFCTFGGFKGNRKVRHTPMPGAAFLLEMYIHSELQKSVNNAHQLIDWWHWYITRLLSRLEGLPSYRTLCIVQPLETSLLLEGEVGGWQQGRGSLSSFLFYNFIHTLNFSCCTCVKLAGNCR